MLTVLAVVVAAALELAVGEPPRRVHPVAWLGRLVAPLDGERARPGLVGLGAAVFVPLGSAVAVAATVAGAATADSRAGVAAAGLALFVATSLRMLLAEARAVLALSEEDPTGARERLPALAGRDPTDLSPGQVRSAAVESAAENLADGLVAPLSAFVVGALAARPLGATAALTVGAGAAAWVKAVNTLDSMVGYPSKPVGRAPARLDDAVMWVPARAAAVLLALVAGRPRALAAARSWQDRLASPNAGWPMGTLAAAADVRLAKPGAYVLDPGADLPTVSEGRAAVRTVGVAGVVAYVAAAGALALAEVAPWS